MNLVRLRSFIVPPPPLNPCSRARPAGRARSRAPDPRQYPPRRPIAKLGRRKSSCRARVRAVARGARALEPARRPRREARQEIAPIRVDADVLQAVRLGPPLPILISS